MHPGPFSSLLAASQACEGDAGDPWEARELGEGGKDVVGWEHADLELVAGVVLVYLGVDGADRDVVAPEDLERALGAAAGFFEGISRPAASRRSG